MTERSSSRSVAISAGISVAVVAGAVVLAVWSHVSRERLGHPQDVLIEAVEHLATTEEFVVTTAHTPDGANEAEETSTFDFRDGRVERLRITSGGVLETDRCSLDTFAVHWLARFGTASESYHRLDLEPEGFRWGWPGIPASGRIASVEFSYFQFSIDSIIPVEATAWIDLSSRELIRIERRISDPLGFQGTAVTTIEYGNASSCA